MASFAFLPAWIIFWFSLMAKPHTLVEAFELLRQGPQKSTNHHQESTNAVDILGVVSNISISSVPFLSSGRPRSRRCQIWLLDESLDSTTSKSNNSSGLVGSRFVLYKSSEIARAIKENVKAGDILRFNRVALKSFGGSFQFQSSVRDPEPGVSWFRLGSIDDCRNDGVDTSIIPKSMITPKQRIVELAEWYNSKRKWIALPRTPNALPTRKRQLNEIQSSVGFLSNIQVSVMCVRLVSTEKRNTTYTSGGRKTETKTQRPPMAFAMFTDDSGAVMSFLDSSGRFLPELQSAHTKRHSTKLVMTNVLTEYQSNLPRSTTTCAEEIILVPTETTMGRLVSEERLSSHSKVTQNRLCDSSSTIQTQEMTAHATTIVVRSSIADICVNGLSLKASPSVFSSSSEFLRTITGKDGNFVKVIIYLDTNDDDQVWSNDILATPNVVKTLCGSLDPGELSNDESLCRYSSRLLQDLLHTEIILDWTLDTDDLMNPKIVEAALYRVPD